MGNTTLFNARADLRRVVYINISLLMIVATLIGFWPTYFQPLLQSTRSYSIILHLHVITMFVWLLLFLTQAYLAAAGNIQRHLKLGELSIWFAIWIVVLSLLVGLFGLLGRTAPDELARGRHVLIEGVSNGILFAVFFALAIRYRRKPKIHRPLMVVTAAATLGPAIGRMDHLNDVLRIIIWFSPIWLSMLHEWRRGRTSVRWIYLVGAAVLLSRFGLARLIENSDPWIVLSQAIINLFS
jgi:hypothetical protein